MHAQQKETLSALFDGEADELEMRRLLAGLDAETCAQWRRFQFVRDVAKNKLVDCHLGVSIADKVAAQIALEPDMRNVAAALVKNTTEKKESWLKPLLGFATAASFAFVAVLGMQQMNQPQIEAAAGFIANGNVSASQLPISSNAGFNMVSGSVQGTSLQSEIDAIEAQKKRDQERLKYYMQLHSEQASLNNDRGLIPMAKMAPAEN